MDIDTLTDRLAREPIVTITAEAWAAVATQLPVLERHDTLLRGDLLVVRTPVGLAAVESPSPGERVIRRLADEQAARRFVADRLDTYERMWNGCGCRIDYHR